jgi:hypothetical protein
MNDERLAALLHIHVSRYPECGVMDMYKLVHQATFGPGHLVASKKTAREWLERETGSLTPLRKAPLVESVHPDGLIVRLHLRPYLAYGVPLKLLLEALVRSAELVQGDPDVMARRWSFFEGLCQSVYAGRFDRQETVLFGRTRAREGWPAVHHSPTYQAAYQPRYRVLARAEAENVSAKISAPFEVI